MTIGTAVVGAGYWGSRLVRNLRAHDQTDLVWLCDLERGRLSQTDIGSASSTTALGDVLDDPRVDLVAIATPAASHFDLAKAALEAGKHVLVEKPVTTTSTQLEILLSIAQGAGLLVLADHTYCYTEAARWIADFVRSGEFGELLWFDSVRANLGLVQPDVDVLFDLVPHDLALLELFFPENPVRAVLATAVDPVGVGRSCLAHVDLRLANAASGHVMVNWLSPIKTRRIVLAGSNSVIVWDDVNPSQRISVFEAGVTLDPLCVSPNAVEDRYVSYRTGALRSPSMPEREALATMLDHVVPAIRGAAPFPTDGKSALRGLRVLEAAIDSVAAATWVVAG